jgi:hypothetical protein
MFTIRAWPRLLLALFAAPSLLAETAQPMTNTDTYFKLPMAFEKNVGQLPDQKVRFLAHERNYLVYLEPTKTTMHLRKQNKKSYSPNLLKNQKRFSTIDHAAIKREALGRTTLTIKLLNANKNATAESLEKLPGVSNYYVGNDKAQSFEGIANYAKVKFNSIYPGIDLVYYGNHGVLEHDFIVSPKATPDTIRFAIEGTKKISLDPKGNLLIGPVQLSKPVIYQMRGNTRVDIAGSYELKGKNTVGFKVASYDKTRPLIIDPQLIYSTFLGDSGRDSGNGIAVDSLGNAYIAGTTDSLISPGLPTAVVTKLNPTGGAELYRTIIGGSDVDIGIGVAVDGLGAAYVCGFTFSGDFFTTFGSFQPALSGPDDGFVAKLNSAGTIVYSTLLGGSDFEIVPDIAVEPNTGSTFVVGFTASNDFPTTASAFQTTKPSSDGIPTTFVTKLNPTGSGLIYSTYLGGSQLTQGISIATNGLAGNAFVTGVTDSADFPTTSNVFQSNLAGSGDVFLTKLNHDGSGLVYSTYFGGSSFDVGQGIAVDAGGNAYVTGITGSIDLPTSPGAFQTVGPTLGVQAGFVAKFNANATALAYSTYLHGSSADEAANIAVSTSGEAFITGNTTSSDFPVTAEAFQTTYAGNTDAFLTRLNSTGTQIVYSTFFGGTGEDRGFDVAVDGAGNAYITGATDSTDFPVTKTIFDQDAHPTDAFAAKFSPVTSPVNHTLLYNIATLPGTHGTVPGTIMLEDRFVKQTVHVGKAVEIGNPVDKMFDNVDSPIVNPNINYVAYVIEELCPFSRQVTASDQFGSLTAQLSAGRVLLVGIGGTAQGPKVISPLKTAAAGTHFRCYDVEAPKGKNPGVIEDGRFVVPKAVVLNDGAGTVSLPFNVVRPAKFCVAAKKTHNGTLTDANIVDNANNYMCYEAIPTGNMPTQFSSKLTDQFGDVLFTTQNYFQLCVPSTITAPAQ